MIVTPRTPEELAVCQMFMLNHAHVQPSADARYIGWVEANSMKICVAFTGFMGKVCQMHVAMAPDFKFSPRKMLKQCFRYAFDTAKCEMVLGVVNSKNAEAMRYDLHLGFKVLYALPGMHDDGGDIVLLGMRKEECRWLNMQETPEPDQAVTH